MDPQTPKTRQTATPGDGTRTRRALALLVMCLSFVLLAVATVPVSA